MDIIVDLDGTICTEEKTFERALAKPIKGAVDALKTLYVEGHNIIIYTARSWSEYKMTEQWLKDNNICYNRLVMGKPVGDVWIDDRAEKFTNWKDILLDFGYTTRTYTAAKGGGTKD